MAEQTYKFQNEAVTVDPTKSTSVNTGSGVNNQVISISQLQPAKPINIPSSQITDNSSALVSGIESTNKSLDQYIKDLTPTDSPEQIKYNQVSNRIADLTAQDTGQEAYRIQQQDLQGLPDLKKQLGGLNTDILSGLAEVNKMDTEFAAQQDALLNQNTITKAVANAQVGGLQRTYALQKAAKVAEIGLKQARAAALGGQIDTAINLADRAVTAKYAPIEDELKVMQAQLNAILPLLNKQDSIRAQAQQQMLEDRRQKIADDKEKQKTLFNLGITSGVTKPFFSVGGTVIRSSDGAAFSNLQEAASAGVDTKTWSNVQNVTPGGFGNFTKIGETVDEYGVSTDVYGFVDSRTGVVKPLGNTSGNFFATGNSLVSSNPNPSKVIGGYDFSTYATDPNWGNAVNNILSKIPNLVNANIAIKQPSAGNNLQSYIESVAKNAPVTSQMIFNSADKYGVDPKILAAILQQESKFGTLGKGANTFNPGNVGNTDSGATRNFGNWQSGVDAVAENMSKRVASPSQASSKPNDPKILAQTIFNGTGNLSDISVKGNLRARVGQELDKLKQDSLKSGDIYGVIRASAGGKEVDATFLQSFEKGVNVLYQIGDLQNSIKNEATDPILGIIRSNNPYDTKAQQIKAQLQAIVPNLARGIYGEVGVLTDNDIANYSKTLPNLKSTEEVRNAILAITLKSVQRSLENKIRTAAGFGRDVSGILNLYQQVDKKVKEIEASLNGQAGANTDFRAWMSGNQSSTLDTLLNGQGF